MKEKIKGSYTTRDGIIYVRGRIDGKYRRYSTEKQDTKINIAWIKRNCDDVLLQLHNEKNKNKNIKINSTNFNDFALDSLTRNATSRADSVNKDYLSYYNRKIKIYFRDYNIIDIKKAQLQDWQNKMCNDYKSIETVKTIRAIFSGILTDAMQNEIIKDNPFKYVPMPEKEFNEEQDEDYINPFNLDEIKKILDLSIGQWKNIFTVLFFTGMRTGECWGLKWEDINFVSKTITFKRKVRHGVVGKLKTKSSYRTIDMLPIVEEALRNQKCHTIARDSFVFMNKNKECFKSAQHITRDVWKPTLKLAGIDYRYLYQTRHTFASLMISQSEDIIWVSKMLGHSSPRITLDVYSKFVPDLKKDRAVFLNEFKDKHDTQIAQHKFKILRSS